ncbi:MAG: T9SS type A sorting domain-containing protein [Gemmatimonadetes bacterium]|nr:T9SS type A sorting domain-containing protein [Gemmatimonadota bacterium]
MKAKIFGLTAPVLALGALVAPANAFQAPTIGYVSDEMIAEARRQVAEAPVESAHDFERDDMDDRWMLDQEPDPRAPGNGDNDATHYARGNTLVLHFFINHTGGTWSQAEMDAAAAKAAIAKDFYRNNAPAGANVEFDNGSNNLYAYYVWNYGANIPTDSMTWNIAEAVSAGIVADSDGDGLYVDDLTYNLQDWAGGWDNVLCVYQPADITGRAFASYGAARCVNYTDDLGSVWAHEWGHIFGSCDEYVEGGQCNGGINCGACQSTYLTTTYNNGNCQLASCPTDVSCIMINNTLSGSICQYTLGHWGWVDSDSNGWMDTTRRRLSGNTMIPIYHIVNNGWYLWSGTEDNGGFAYHQNNRSWGVAGLRSPGTDDYDLRLYADNNHDTYLAGSSFGGQLIDFVVGDYNHNNLGNEHLEVRRWSGTGGNYRLHWESGTGILYPDGVARSFSLASTDVVRCWEVPLFGGETISFVLDNTSGSGDIGMSLFKSNGSDYYAGRGSAVWTADNTGASGTETYTYTVPSDDVYGLVVFNNTAASSDYTIQIGPTPVTLAEESPFHSGLDLRLYNYDPAAGYWSVIGTRPTDSATDTEVELYAESTYQTLLDQTTYGVGAVDFIAVDYNHASSAADYVRVNRQSGTATHRTEWEQSADVISGITGSYNFDAGHVVKVWDAFLTNGWSYAVRSYQGGFNDGLYLFDSSDGDYYQDRAEFDGYSSGGAAGAGEFLKYQADASDWHGLVQTMFDEASGTSSLWFGREIGMNDDAAASYSEEVLWGETTTNTSQWWIWAVKPTGGEEARISLYGDEPCTITTLKASDQTGVGVVNYVVGDYNHTPFETVYPRVWRQQGSQPMRVEAEGGTETIIYLGGGVPVTYDASWPSNDVAEIYDLYLPFNVPTRIVVEPLTGSADFEVALFQSFGATYYANAGQAIANADANGAGGMEIIDVVPTANDYYGLAIINTNGLSGTYRITVGSQTAVSADLPTDVTELSFAAFPNPSRDDTTFRLALPQEERVTVDVFDVSGRLVRQVQSGNLPAGHHALRWDGRDTLGRPTVAGVYLARLRTSAGEEIRKITRLN